MLNHLKKMLVQRPVRHSSTRATAGSLPVLSFVGPSQKAWISADGIRITTLVILALMLTKPALAMNTSPSKSNSINTFLNDALILMARNKELDEEKRKAYARGFLNAGADKTAKDAEGKTAYDHSPEFEFLKPNEERS